MENDRRKKAAEQYEQKMRVAEEREKKRAEGGFESDYIKIDILPKFEDKEKRTLRILPTKDALQFYLDNSENEDAIFADECIATTEICNHFNVGSRRQPVACLNFFNNEPCPVCEENDELYKTGDSDDKKLSEEMRRSFSHVYFVIWREHEDHAKPEDAEKIWAYHTNATVDTRLTGMFGNPKIPFLDGVFEGTDIEVTRIGTGMKGTNYTVDDTREQSFLFTNEDGDFDYEAADRLVAKLPDIFEYGKPFLNYEETKAVLLGSSIKEVVKERHADDAPAEKKEEPKKEAPKRGTRGRK
jgi:hypothetical protein